MIAMSIFSYTNKYIFILVIIIWTIVFLKKLLTFNKLNLVKLAYEKTWEFKKRISLKCTRKEKKKLFFEIF